jgi:hypothetical protein
MQLLRIAVAAVAHRAAAAVVHHTAAVVVDMRAVVEAAEGANLYC